jgi:hypothetical protein
MKKARSPLLGGAGFREFWQGWAYGGDLPDVSNVTVPAQTATFTFTHSATTASTPKLALTA